MMQERPGQIPPLRLVCCSGSFCGTLIEQLMRSGPLHVDPAQLPAPVPFSPRGATFAPEFRAAAGTARTQRHGRPAHARARRAATSRGATPPRRRPWPAPRAASTTPGPEPLYSVGTPLAPSVRRTLALSCEPRMNDDGAAQADTTLAARLLQRLVGRRFAFPSPALREFPQRR